MPLSLTDAKDLATIVAALTAVATLLKGVYEYSRQGAQKRAEHFFALRNRLKTDETFKTICDLLETDDPGLTEIPFKDKRDFLGLFEEVALSLNSGLIRRPVAHYMFGYYAIHCWNSRHFWSTVNRESSYWSVFRDFVASMEAAERRFVMRRRQLRF